MERTENDRTEPPLAYIETGEIVYSNSDHQLETAVAERLRTQSIVGGHAAWSFYGLVWFDRDTALWHEVVKSYRVVVAHYTGATVEAVIRQTNEAHGYD